MAFDFVLHAGDTYEPLEAVLRDGRGAYIDPTGTTPVLSMWPHTVPEDTANTIDAAPMTVAALTLPDGTIRTGVRYDWASGQTATRGEYDAKIVLTWQGGKRETFPKRRPFFRVLIW